MDLIACLKKEQTAKIIVLPDERRFLVSGNGYNSEGQIKNLNAEVKNVIKQGVINNEAKITASKPMGDSIDIAFLYLGKKAKLTDNEWPILKMIPYESENKFSAVFYEENSKVYCTV